jgi:hypothetical protein
MRIPFPRRLFDALGDQILGDSLGHGAGELDFVT